MSVVVRMLADRNGGRFDGRDWPPRGGVFTVSDTEAAHLIAAGDAEAVKEDAAPASAAPAAHAAAGAHEAKARPAAGKGTAHP